MISPSGLIWPVFIVEGKIDWFLSKASEAQNMDTPIHP